MVYDTLNHWICGLCPLPIKHQRGNRSTFRNILFSSYLESRMMDEVNRASNPEFSLFFKKLMKLTIEKNRRTILYTRIYSLICCLIGKYGRIKCFTRRAVFSQCVLHKHSSGLLNLLIKLMASIYLYSSWPISTYWRKKERVLPYPKQVFTSVLVGWINFKQCCGLWPPESWNKHWLFQQFRKHSGHDSWHP
jgi:hypothetical protein